MARIQVRVAGDQWMNRDKVIEDIKNSYGAKHLIFEINTEGPSLYALGIVDTILANISAIGIAPDKVWIDRWHNTVEQIPFKRAYKPRLSHFFWMSDSYRHAPKTPAADAHALAFFVGRLTVERAAMLWDVVHRWPTQCLTSLMRQSGPLNFSLSDIIEPWINQTQAQEFMAWARTPSIQSITDHCVKDQYLPGNDTNRALIAHYDRFCMELVAETYCLGDTFFPTEKTIRPLSQAKSMMVYGPKNFLSRLRELGFQTWGDIWDESYDCLQGHARWIALKRALKDVMQDQLYLDPRLLEINQHNARNLDILIEKYSPQ